MHTTQHATRRFSTGPASRAYASRVQDPHILLLSLVHHYLLTFTSTDTIHSMMTKPKATLPPEIWSQVIKHLKRPLPPMSDGKASWKDLHQQDLVNALTLSKVG